MSYLWVEPRGTTFYRAGMIIIAALYKFVPFPNPADLCGPLARLCAQQGVKGTLLLADEGINGTIAGSRADIDAVMAHIQAFPGCDNLTWKESQTATMPFGRMKVRLRPEIVTMGVPGTNPSKDGGTHVAPVAWNALIQAPDVAVIDTRNAYEVAIGTFTRAINPEIDTFRDFPAWWQANKVRFHAKKIAMFCTGGIRCEKSTAYLKMQGVEEVYQLSGGILKYLEQVPADQSLWKGGCFVFDRRVAVTHGVVPLPYTLCHACRAPLTPQDRQRPEFEDGVQCHRCIDSYSSADRARFRERQRQMILARARGKPHIDGIS